MTLSWLNGKTFTNFCLPVDATYFRGTVWSNLKCYTIEKKVKRYQTGAAGDLKVKWTDVDNLVIDIIGVDSPTVNGLNVPESSASQAINMFLVVRSQLHQMIPQRQRSENGPWTINEFQLTAATDMQFINEFRAKKLLKLDFEIENLTLRNKLLGRQLDKGFSAMPSLPDSDIFVYQTK